MEDVKGLSENTSVPLQWVFTLIGLFLGSLGAMVAVGLYIGALNAQASQSAHRIDILEANQEAVQRVDRRLARIEGELGVKIPAEDRIPDRHAP